jgi:hypothetical protein
LAKSVGWQVILVIFPASTLMEAALVAISLLLNLPEAISSARQKTMVFSTFDGDPLISTPSW